MDTLPKDAMLCLSVVNTRLRDVYPTLETLCAELDVEQDMLMKKMAEIDYVYDKEQNQFI
ncbi:MAG: DUF4250 domain-containing protein [Faecalimonas sp.]|nr:DUF4250 domain-containing protein [Faecalimonas sp.]